MGWSKARFKHIHNGVTYHFIDSSPFNKDPMSIFGATYYRTFSNIFSKKLLEMNDIYFGRVFMDAIVRNGTDCKACGRQIFEFQKIDENNWNVRSLKEESNKTLPHADHIVPSNSLGMLFFGNIIYLCFHCNMKKTDMDPEVFFRHFANRKMTKEEFKNFFNSEREISLMRDRTGFLKKLFELQDRGVPLDEIASYGEKFFSVDVLEERNKKFREVFEKWKSSDKINLAQESCDFIESLIDHSLDKNPFGFSMRDENLEFKKISDAQRFLRSKKFIEEFLKTFPDGNFLALTYSDFKELSESFDFFYGEEGKKNLSYPACGFLVLSRKLSEISDQFNIEKLMDEENLELKAEIHWSIALLDRKQEKARIEALKNSRISEF